MDEFPAIAILKGECPQDQQALTPLLAQMLADKGINQEAVRYLASQSPRFLRVLFGHLVMRYPHPSVLEQMLPCSLATLSLPPACYQGTRQENRRIDGCIHSSSMERGEGLRSVTWRGAAGAYLGGGLSVPKQMRQSTQILIIGAGAAGILAARALSNAGFQHILLFDQSGKIGGIWKEDFLARASRANPFPLRVEQCVLEAAPGPGSEVAEFLQTLASPSPHSGMQPLPRVVKAQVLTITPCDLGHQVLYQDDDGEQHELTVPIVINALGVGDPLSPSRPGTMTTDVPPDSAGIRWQEVWTEAQARQYHGRTLLFISLSNSTFEMVKQIQRLNLQGLDIRYRILTHYPSAALADPLTRMEYRGTRFRLYRDPSRYELLRLAGDLPDAADAFVCARDTGQIVPHVTHWSIEQHAGERQVVAVREDGDAEHIPCDELYTLIGYGPHADMLGKMGLRVNHPYLGAVDLDYDSEVHREEGISGRSRLWPGYFCLGIRNAFNQNEVLLPGLLFRLPDLVAGVILRSAEYCVRSRP